MDNNIGTNPFEEEKSKPPLIPLTILGMGLVGCCVVFIAAFIFFKPDQLSLSDRYFPSPTATLTPTQTSTPTLTPTPTPNLTATQQVIRSTATAQAIQILATDSISQWSVLLSDTFDSNENNWATGFDQSDRVKITRKITGGKYQWDATSIKGFIAWIPADTKSVGDFSLTVETQRTNGSSLSDSGLIFRKDAKDNFYYLTPCEKS